MKPIKLTKPQEALLRKIAGSPWYAADGYAPRERLLKLAFAEDVGFGMLAIATAGREWLKERDAK